MVKNPPANAGDARDVTSILGSGRSPEGGNGNPLQYSCLENSMERAAWRATVHGVTKSRTWLSMHAAHIGVWLLYNVVLTSTVQHSESASSVQSISRVWLFATPMDYSTPGLPVHHQLPEFTQTHVHWVRDAIQSSHPLSFPSSPAFNLSQHQDLYKWVNSSHQVAKVLEFQLQHQSFQWTLRTDLL